MLSQCLMLQAHRGFCRGPTAAGEIGRVTMAEALEFTALVVRNLNLSRRLPTMS
jgi:hypothetical protein